MSDNRQPLILVIDEMPSRMKAFQEMMKNQPLTVKTIDALAQAKEQIETHKPDLVVMDLSSRFAEKKAICERVFTHKKLQTKFLFIVPTSFPELMFVPADRLAGHITKPFYLGDVLGKVHAALYDKYLRQMAT